MKATFEQVVHEASELSPQDRWRLIGHLMRELESAEDVSEAEIEKAWDGEISRRLAEIDSGAVKPVPAEEVFARIQARLDEAS
ncbi:MAG TPA: addiction module protein [Candidatus Angelobacter sp.]|nr:addiction module protein [Candidatus Angelobacter sp.]